MDLDGSTSAAACNDDSGESEILGGRVRVSALDQVFDYLSGKLDAGSNITLTVINSGSAEKLRIAAASGGASVSNQTPCSIGVASAGASNEASRADHIHAITGMTVNQLIRGSSSGGITPLSAGSEERVLRIASGIPAYGQLTVNGISDGALTADATGRAKMADDFVNYDKIAHIGALAIPGNPTNSTGPMQDIAFGTDHFVLARAGTTLTTKLVGTSNLADDVINFAKTAYYLERFTATAANDFDIALPVGFRFNDVNGYYIRIRGSAAASAFFDILLDGTDTCDETVSFLEMDATTLSASGVSDGPGVISSTAGNAIDMLFFTRNGFERVVYVTSIGKYSGTLRRYVLHGRWADTSTAITSIRFRIDGGANWTAGTEASVWAF